jgi:hypothetical protein
MASKSVLDAATYFASLARLVGVDGLNRNREPLLQNLQGQGSSLFVDQGRAG